MLRNVPPPSPDPQTFWTQHNVTSHHRFTSAAESADYFDWRNAQYPGYIELMPVSGFDGAAVLDFGCGPGHDLVGFGTSSKPSRLVGADVSSSSLAESRHRLALHGIPAELIELMPGAPLPFDDDTFDHVHSSGVLHHLPDPEAALRELRRVLRSTGTASVMVYNSNSIWMHLKVAYQRTLVEGLYPDLTLEERFARSTDGENCPISRSYLPEAFVELAGRAGFAAVFAGAAISLIELDLLPLRNRALMDLRLPAASRRFLATLTFDHQMMPCHDGHRAGIAAIYHMRRRAH
jgi:ubiquinone/menaquinone biosynthesis C-methylase UbiE